MMSFNNNNNSLLSVPSFPKELVHSHVIPTATSRPPRPAQHQNNLFKYHFQAEPLPFSTPVPQEDTTLFVGDLSVYCTEKDLLELFCSFGTIEAVTIKRHGNKSSCYGFLRFKRRQDADRAKQQMNGYLVHGRKMR